MDPRRIRIASNADRDQAIRTITVGFLADPVCRWIWPDAKTYLDAMPEFVAAFGGKAFETGSAYMADNGKAAALWLPPNVDPDGGTVDALFAATVTPEILSDLTSIFAQMEDYHPHEEACWYLPLIATDPVFTGKGLGGTILKQALRRCDADGLIAYLESSNPRNMSLYERHGFEAIGQIQAGSSPTLYPMVRKARH